MLGLRCGIIGEEVGEAMIYTKGYDALLLERMRRLGLSPAEVDDADRKSMPLLQNTCSSCALKARCTQDLAAEQGGDAVAAYCLNEERLASLSRRTRQS